VAVVAQKNEIVKEVVPAVEEAHFEEVQARSSVEDVVVVAEKVTKNFREPSKKKPVKETPPVSPKNQPAPPPAQKPVERKKRSEPTTSAVAESVAIQFASDANGIQPLLRELGHADLTKNQIQVLIDYLLNKQSDTIGRDPTEWTEGKADLVQKLKKQLQEKEAQLKNEQDALVGMQAKLKELRGEINTEKSQFNSNMKAHQEMFHNSRLEIKQLQSEMQILMDKHNSEKNSMSLSFKQLQAQYMQTKEALKAQEALPNIQQENQMLQQEIVKKNQQIMELNVFVDDSRQKDVSFDFSELLSVTNLSFQIRRKHTINF